MQKIINWVKVNEKTTLFLLVIFFVLIRLPGVHLPLHQDEYKWPEIVNPTHVSATEIPHPPLSQFIYRTAGHIVGYNVNFRFVPLFFGTINLLLLYYFLKEKFGKKVAFTAGIFFTLSYYSVLASLMVDTDGQILPFFFLLALISYHKSIGSVGDKRYFWGSALVLSCVLGLFVKVSFILAVGAIVADFLWEKKSSITKGEIVKYLGYGLGGIISVVFLLFISQYVFSFFSLTKALTYWEHFAELNRNWFQTGIQVVKAVLYTSPFLILTPFIIGREDLKKVRPFLFYILFGMIFYTILFDFSIGALDRYLQFLIIPLCAISSFVFVSIIKLSDSKRNKEYLLLGMIFSLIILSMLFIQHFVPPLHPKSEWISRVLSLRWNFLYPFSGGSGPLGFYVSFLFMALVWISSFALILLGFIKPHFRKMALLIILPISLVYNGIFIEEYLFGEIYGSAPKLITPAVEFIKNNPDIKDVTVYNDNGGNEIQTTGKYGRRLYIDPKFEVNLQEKINSLNAHKEHYFVLDIPRFDSNTMYQRYFDTCEVIYKQTDKQISATVYDCRKAIDLKN
ncbi:MAG: glycosyltransferase family 39 protein [Minisyncoccia bacterium]